MIPESVKPAFISLLAATLSPGEIDQLGKHFDPKFRAHQLSGQPFGITLRPEQCAKIVVDHVAGLGKLQELIEQVLGCYIHRDSSQIVAVEAGDEADTWGLMREGESYDFTFLSIDIAGNSKLQQMYKREDIELVYEALYNMIRNTIARHNGKLWSWAAGDGGLAAFYLEPRSESAINCALEIQLSLISFNLSKQLNRLGQPIRVRIAAHSGPAVYKEDKGAILSEAINYVTHLEKKGCEPESLAITRPCFEQLNDRWRSVFRLAGSFEEITVYMLPLRFDWMARLEQSY